MGNRIFLPVLVALVSLAAAAGAGSLRADTLSPSSNPLQPFERLVGGQWHLENSYQVFEWGVGRQSIRARSYFVVDGQAKLVSEGGWYWHPAQEVIKGTFTAIEMPVVFFDYTTRFEANTMVNELKAYAANGKETVFAETWEFVDDTHFEWKLTSELPDGSEAMMSGTYVRTSPEK